MSAAGWVLAALLAPAVAELRRRLELVARADHELRGPATAVALGVERLAEHSPECEALRVELDRLRAGLDDLACARAGGRRPLRRESFELAPFVGAAAAAWAPALWRAGRSVRLDWAVGPVQLRADRGRLAQVLGNLVANAAEHGRGQVEVVARPSGGGVRLEVRNEADGDARPAPGRGRGLAIAAAAAEEMGGRLGFRTEDGRAVAALDLPAEAA